MSDSDGRPQRRRSREHHRQQSESRRGHSRDRKHHRSRSSSLERHESRKKRYKSPRKDRYEGVDHDQRDEREDRHRRYRSRDEPRKNERNRSPDDSRRHRRRSRSQESRTRSHRREDDRQLAYTGRQREDSRDRRRHHRYSSSQSPPRRSRHKHSPSPTRRSKAPLPSQQDAFSTNRNSNSNTTVGPPIEKQKPNYSTSGKLAAETNTVRIGDEAIILKYHEPPEARKPPSSQAWRMYEFKGDTDEPLSTTILGNRSCWLFGREKAVVDFLIEHPSCSKQHAVIQFRYHEKRSEFGDKVGMVKPYVLDLESANGVKVNGNRIPDRRYIELKSGDAVGFGESTREYIVLLPPKEKNNEQ